MSRRSFARAAAALSASVALITCAVVIAGLQEKGNSKKQYTPPRARTPDPAKSGRALVVGVTEAEVNALIEKTINDFDLKPKPLPAIPNDPPPHEGALIDLPYIVEPPDMLIVEVLETLPGRPISGERLVRPDGKISLGFYGEVYVRGLTIPQVKVAIIKLLRKYLSDEILGLKTMEVTEPGPPGQPQPRPLPELPDDQQNPLDSRDKGKSAPKAKTGASLGERKFRTAALTNESTPIAVRRMRARAVSQEPEEKNAAAGNLNPILIPFPGQGQVRITIEVQGQNPVNFFPQEPNGPPIAAQNGWEGELWKIVPPQDSDRVFVDVTAYHSKNYYVQGNVHVPGRLPCTGSETVLDAIQYVGGLLASADPTNIILVRPGRNGGRPSTYSVNLDDIRDRGEVLTNYQLLPGDRLVVGSPRGVRQQARREGANDANPPVTALSGSRMRARSSRAIDDPMRPR